MEAPLLKGFEMGTHNVTLARFVVSLQNIATRYWIWQMEKQSPDDQRRDVELHRELARAIAARDPSAAEQAAIELVGAPPSDRGRL
jgi:DNA-binding FadR family transcriptional regulator